MRGSTGQESVALIYQIVGNLNYERVQYVVENKTRKVAKFSSLALARHYINEGAEARVEFLIPLSIREPPVDEKGNLHLQSFTQKIMEELETDGEEDVKIGVSPIPAIGNYRLGGKYYQFEATPQSIAATVFFHMLEDVNLIEDDQKKVKLILDVSTGHNAYIPPLFDAARAITVLDKILGGLKNYKLTQVKYAVAEPVSRDIKKDSYQIFLIDYNVKAFMSFPYNHTELDKAANIPAYIKLEPQEKKRVADLFGDREELKKLLRQALLAFNAVKYNAPLAILNKELIELDPKKATEVMRSLASLFKEILKPTISEGRVKVTEIDFRSLANLFISLTLYIFIARKVTTLNIPIHEKGVDIEKLLVFKDIYELIDMQVNSLILESEILKIKGERPSDIKRNFFAHAGLSKDTIKEVKENGKKYVKYNQGKINEIRAWLSQPYTEKTNNRPKTSRKIS